MRESGSQERAATAEMRERNNFELGSQVGKVKCCNRGGFFGLPFRFAYIVISPPPIQLLLFLLLLYYAINAILYIVSENVCVRELKSKRAGGCDGWPTNLDVTLSVCL